MDLLIEVGPGAVLSHLVRETADIPVIALDAGGNSLGGLLHALGAAFALGAPVKHAALFADRFTRPFNLDWKPKFFANPCELAPVSEAVERRAPSRPETDNYAATRPRPCAGAPIELIRRLVAARAELPTSAVRDGSRMLSDLHLNSITVGQLVSEAAKQLGLPRIVGLTDFANASVAEIARALEELQRTGGAARKVNSANRHRAWTTGCGLSRSSWVKRNAGIGARLFPAAAHPTNTTILNNSCARIQRACCGWKAARRATGRFSRRKIIRSPGRCARRLEKRTRAAWWFVCRKIRAWESFPCCSTPVARRWR